MSVIRRFFLIKNPVTLDEIYQLKLLFFTCLIFLFLSLSLTFFFVLFLRFFFNIFYFVVWHLTIEHVVPSLISSIQFYFCSFIRILLRASRIVTQRSKIFHSEKLLKSHGHRSWQTVAPPLVCIRHRQNCHYYIYSSFSFLFSF